MGLIRVTGRLAYHSHDRIAGIAGVCVGLNTRKVNDVSIPQGQSTKMQAKPPTICAIISEGKVKEGFPESTRAKK